MSKATHNNDQFESVHKMAMRFFGILLSAVLCLFWMAPVHSQGQPSGSNPRQERAFSPAGTTGAGRQALPPTPGPTSPPMPGLRRGTSWASLADDPSSFKGITRDRKDGKWRVRINFHRKRCYLGK